MSRCPLCHLTVVGCVCAHALLQPIIVSPIQRPASRDWEIAHPAQQDLATMMRRDVQSFSTASAIAVSREIRGTKGTAMLVISTGPSSTHS